MYRGDFEPANSHLLSGKMLKGQDIRPQVFRPKRVFVKKPKPERRLRISGQPQQEYKGEITYPHLSKKKIFGMQPKTLIIALGVIVIGIWVLKQTESTAVVQQNNMMT